MKLTDKTFAEMITALQDTYINWELPEGSVTTWKNALAVSIVDELLPQVILDWVLNVTTPPKNPAEIIKHASDMVKKKYGSADTSADILIESARNAYTVSNDFISFVEDYKDSFASAFGTPAEEAYIMQKVFDNSGSPSVLIMVYDEYKGELKDCFTGDAERGVEFLRNQIKKKWNEKATETAKDFLRTGEIGVIRGKMLLGSRHPRNLLGSSSTDVTTL